MRCEHRERAVSTLWAGVSMVVVVGLVGLAVDTGHVVHVQQELQAAADAAAMAGAEIVEVDSSGAVTQSISVAGQNKANAETVRLAAGDVVVGHYHRPPEPRPGFVAGEQPYNAVRVTTRRTASSPGGPVPLFFGPLFGVRTCEVTRTATAMALPNPSGGMIGYTTIIFKNNFYFGAYDSRTDPGGNRPFFNALAWIGSNGLVDGKNNDVVDGTLKLGPAGVNGGVRVNGPTASQSAPLAFPTMPAWSPPPGQVGSYTATGTTVLPGGTYYWSSLTVAKNASLSFSGRATVYVNGDINIGGSLTAYQSKPGNLRIYQFGNNRLYSTTMAGSNHIDITADLWAPEATITAKNDFTFRGRAFFGAFDVGKNTAEFLYDMNLKYAGHVFLVE